jgi:Transposase DDE domain
MTLQAKDYCQFLTSTHINYTNTYFSDHKQVFSHDRITRFLANSSLNPLTIFHKTSELITQSPNSYLIFDDSVIDKNYSSKIEGVRKQYSGNAKRVIKGIGLVGCIYYNPELDEAWLLDYKLYDPEEDSTKKTDHMLNMIDFFVGQNIQFKGVLVDAGYSIVKLFKKLEALNKTYVCNIKSNRKCRLFGTDNDFAAVKELDLDNNNGQLIQLNQLNSTHQTRIFKSQLSTERTDYLVTNDPNIQTLEDIQTINRYRWKIEQFHREIKQNTGIQSCQCRKRNSQKNHIMCSLMVWVDLKLRFHQTGVTMYQQKEQLLSDYLRKELENPSLEFRW